MRFTELYTGESYGDNNYEQPCFTKMVRTWESFNITFLVSVYLVENVTVDSTSDKI
jgi:hypothetical protein